MYIEFTEEQKRRANEADLVTLLERNGQQVRRVGSEYEWKDGDQTVSIKDNLWYHQYEQIGGNTVGFVRKFWGLSYPEAVQFILDEDIQSAIIRVSSYPNRSTSQAYNSQFKPPDRNENMNIAYTYLVKTRGINNEVVRSFERAGLIYESRPYHNVVFLGKDKEGRARHAHKRSTAKDNVWRANEKGSNNRFTFNWRGKSGRLFLFEAPIDMLSYITMFGDGWSEENFLAACSVSDSSLEQFVEDRPDISQVYICFDSDPPGQKAALSIQQKLSNKGINSEILVPTLKDWNEDLLNSVQEVGDAECQAVSQLL